MFLDAFAADVFFRPGPGVGSEGEQEWLIPPGGGHDVAPFGAEAATSRFSGHIFPPGGYMLIQGNSGVTCMTSGFILPLIGCLR